MFEILIYYLLFLILGIIIFEYLIMFLYQLLSLLI